MLVGCLLPLLIFLTFENNNNARRLEYLGKKGSITSIMSQMRLFDADGKKALGAKVNEVKQQVEAGLAEKKERVREREIMAKMEVRRVSALLAMLLKRNTNDD